jgi:hypothetical protein
MNNAGALFYRQLGAAKIGRRKKMDAVKMAPRK